LAGRLTSACCSAGEATLPLLSKRQIAEVRHPAGRAGRIASVPRRAAATVPA
jgi:hypothetical protein